jgi:hypothetical protein
VLAALREFGRFNRTDIPDPALLYPHWFADAHNRYLEWSVAALPPDRASAVLDELRNAGLWRALERLFEQQQVVSGIQTSA